MKWQQTCALHVVGLFIKGRIQSYSTLPLWIHTSFWHAKQSYGAIPTSEKQTHIKIIFFPSCLENAAAVPLTDSRQFKEAGHAIYPSPGSDSIHTVCESCILPPHVSTDLQT